MNTAPAPVNGAYASKQLFGPTRVLRWSHGSRLRMALELVRPHAPGPLLDYGCGDGTFLALAAADFPHRVGVEIDPDLVRQGAARAASVPVSGPGSGGPARFLHVSEADTLDRGRFAAVVCLEVLEHCTEEALQEAIRRLSRLVAPAGVVVVSVPIETGPALVVKGLFRRVAASRGAPGYAEGERYTARELVTAVAGRPPRPRPVYETRFSSGEPNFYHGHKGFDWRRMRDRLERTFDVEPTRFSPLPALGPLFNAQAWFLCRPR